MGYVDDACLNQFTGEQARRMRCSLEYYRPDVYTIGQRTCGNSILDTAEACDDGNYFSGDGCDSLCRLESTCGNGIVEALEECDDGNVLPGDGCSELCTIEGLGDCCETGHGAGCSVEPVESCVCALDPACCSIGWDSLCVGDVDDFGCGTCLVDTLPGEVSPPGAFEPLGFSAVDAFAWEPAAGSGADVFNVYRGELSELALGTTGFCLYTGLEANATSDTGLPRPGVGWFYLVSGRNALGEGTLGTRSSNVPRPKTDACP
jgi:cysteine-rich repeat protein